MSLNDLNQELYSPHPADAAARTHEQSAYDPTLAAKAVSASPFEGDEKWHPVQKGFSSEKKKKLWIGFAIFMFIVLTVGGAYFYQWWTKNAFHQDRVSISFEGPKEADSTKAAKYIIHYTNNNRITLKNAEIQLSYPENFQPTDNVNLKYLSPAASKIFIGDIKPMSSGQTELIGFFYAPKDFPAYLRGEIHFVPSNAAQELFVASQIGVNITASPVVLTVTAPQQLASGDRMEYVVTYKNLDAKTISKVQIRIDFPQGFEMSDSQPKPSEKDAYWYVGDLEPNQGGKITIHGSINGGSEDTKNVSVSLGHADQNDQFVLYDKQELATRMVDPVLKISQKIDNVVGNVVENGALLRYAISYQNTSNIGMRDAIITAKVNGKVFDFSTMKVEKGSFDADTNIITWKASDVPELANIAPGASGKVNFAVSVKSIIPIESADDKNFIISSVAKIDSPDIPTPIDSNKIIGSNNLELKLASRTLFTTNGFYTDTKIKNSGPLPMVVKAETTFTLHWQIISISDDITNAKVVSSLPSGVRWTGKIFPANEKISYDSRTNQLIWDAGTIKAGSGATNSAREVAFQVGVTPQINQIGTQMELLNKSTFTGRNEFVGRDLSLEADKKNTALSEDVTVGYNNSKVSK